MAGNLSCNTDFLIVNNSVSVKLTLLIKNLSKSNRLLSGMTLHKRNKQNIRYALSIKFSKQLLNLLNRKNEIALPNIRIKNRNNSLEIRFNFKNTKNQLIKQNENLLLIHKYDNADLKFKFVGELYSALFKGNKSPKKQPHIKKDTSRKEAQSTTKQTKPSSSAIQEKKKYTNKSSKVKIYYDLSVIERKPIQNGTKKVNVRQDGRKNQTKLEQPGVVTQRQKIEQDIKDKKGIYLSRSKWRNCGNCLSLQKYNICSVFKVEVDDNNCCKRFYPITVTLGGGFSPR
jgi:hypothetical protein